MNPYESPKHPGQPPAQRATNAGSAARGIFVFLLAWCLLATVAHFLIPMDPTGDPMVDAETARIGIVVGPIVLTLSAFLGMVEYRRARAASVADMNGR